MSELASGWVNCTFGDIARIRNGYAFKSSTFKKVQTSESDVPLIRQSQLGSERVDLSQTVYLAQAFVDEFQGYIVSKGDVLIGLSGSIGKLSIYDEDFPALQNQRTGLVEQHGAKQLSNKYFWLFLSTIEKKLLGKGKGVGVQNVSGKDIEALKFALPPLNEQHRIVAKIEELFLELEKGVESLKVAKAQLAVYRQSVLKAAFEGKLTESWRAEHADELESAAELVARTPQPPRPNRWNTRSKEIIHSHAGLAVGNPQTDLPDGWVWCALVDVARMESGHTPSRKHPEWWNGDIPWIGIADAKAHTGSTIHNTFQHTNEDGLANSAARLLPPGTVCISRTASVGYVVVMGRDMATSQDFVNWVPTDAVTSDWLRVIFGADREYLRRFGKGTVHKTIYFPEWLSVHVALPPLEEQHQIIQEIEARFSVVEKMEQAIEEDLQKAEALRQSILKRAFEGKLVPQDPNDEPASELLDCIRAERAKVLPSPRRKRKEAA